MRSTTINHNDYKERNSQTLEFHNLWVGNSLDREERKLNKGKVSFIDIKGIYLFGFCFYVVKQVVEWKTHPLLQSEFEEIYWDIHARESIIV